MTTDVIPTLELDLTQIERPLRGTLVLILYPLYGALRLRPKIWEGSHFEEFPKEVRSVDTANAHLSALRDISRTGPRAVVSIWPIRVDGNPMWVDPRRNADMVLELAGQLPYFELTKIRTAPTGDWITAAVKKSPCPIP